MSEPGAPGAPDLLSVGRGRGHRCGGPVDTRTRQHREHVRTEAGTSSVDHADDGAPVRHVVVTVR
jgi:hypothetical protein